MRIVRRSALPVAIGTLVILAALSGCSTVEHTTAGSEIYQNSETVTGVVYRASGSHANAADDAEITVETLETEYANPLPKETTTSIFPWTVTRPGANGDLVRMTVKSLSEDGVAECQISFEDTIIHDVAKGDHPKAVCEGRLTFWKDHVKQG